MDTYRLVSDRSIGFVNSELKHDLWTILSELEITFYIVVFIIAVWREQCEEIGVISSLKYLWMYYAALVMVLGPSSILYELYEYSCSFLLSKARGAWAWLLTSI
jgi:hypothetical protein